MAQPKEPDEIEGDIYDEVYNLEKWRDILSDLIANNDISQEEFDSEMLKTNYYIDIKTKTYVLDDEDAEIISKLNKYKTSLTENYKYGLVSLEQFNREYIPLLRKEYDILKLSESEDQSSKKIDFDIDAPLSEKLKKLQESEIKYYKTIAKKYGIIFPGLPKGYNKEAVNQYYDLKLKNNVQQVIPEIEDYIQKYNTAKQLVDYNTSSFEVAKIFYDYEKNISDFQFRMVAPISSKLDDLKIQSKRISLLAPDEQIFSERLSILKNNLRQINRKELLDCVKSRTVKYMSYIERLKENKHNVFKFRSHPENYEMLKKIIIDENTMYYKIPSDQLFKEYIYARPDIFDVKTDKVNQYLEKGNTGYLAIKPNSDLKDLGEGLDNFITVMPLEDNLYTKLKNKSGNNTEITQVWELTISLPGSKTKNLSKRYLSFDDYLIDLKEILIDNSKNSSGTIRDILNSRIRKINYYLKYKEDPELYLSSGHTSISDLFRKKVEIYNIRQANLYKLLDLITIYYPGADTLVQKIESDIFDYSSHNYKFNVSKIIFLINNHQEKLDELVEGKMSIIDLLTYETPKTLPIDDIDIRSDKQTNIDYLLKWKPDTSLYNKYKTDLENINYRFYKFKKNNPKLTNLEISQIMSEYSESLQWNRSLEKYRELKIPEGYIELNFRLRYLLRERNKLPSRRIFTLATVSDRIFMQDKLTNVFKKCKVPEPHKYSILTENIIYGLSRTPEEYSYYNDIISSQYKKLCEYFSKINLKCKLDKNGEIKCILSFEPNVLTPAITEFLITQGEFDTVDVQKLKLFVDKIDSEKVISYINSLRGPEIDAYNRSIMDQINTDSTPLKEIYLKASRILKSARFKDQLENLALISYNTYKPPVITSEKPIKIRYGKEYTPEYIKIEDYYVYGGFYPMFNTYSKDGTILKDNYTRNDLEQLATIFNLDLMEDSFELYKNIMNFIHNYNKKDIITEMPNFNPIEYNTYYEYLKIPTKTITYTYRPRIGVENPGEVYAVIKDQVRTYGVPFDFNEDTIPIYSINLKQRVDDGFIIIEGPCIFQETAVQNDVTSDSYINIEYKDSRGKSKIFREGVSPKNIMRRKIDSLNTCSRFQTRASCDNPNSYSLDVDGLKFKCKWLNDKCKGVIVASDELRNFQVNKIKFKNYSKNKLWKEALNRSIKYIEELTRLKDLTSDEIKILTKEQKTRLLNYYKTLNKPDKKLDSIPEERVEVKSYSLVDEFKDLLKPDNNVFKFKKTITEGYTDLTIYHLKSDTMKYPMKKIIIDSEYLVNGDIVIPKEYHEEDRSYTCKIKDTDNLIILEKEEFRRKGNEIITKTFPLFCLVKNEDLPFLKNLPGYYFYNKTITYTATRDNQINKNEEIIKSFDVPLNFINPSSLLNGKPLITREDIFDAISRTAFSTLMTEDSFIYYVVDKVNADKNAIEFAVKNKIDINNMFTKIIGTITLPDVIEEYELKNPKKIITKEEITNILLEAIDKKDKKTLIEYIVRAKKSKIDPQIIKEAKQLIKDLPEHKKEVKEDSKQPEIEPVVLKNVYTSNRRRR